MSTQSRKQSSSKGLGSGLASLLGDVGQNITQDLATISGDNTNNNGLVTLEIYKLYPGQYQPRRQFDENALNELAQSIKESGMIQPIIVRHNPKSDISTHEIIAGERRWRAAQKAKLRHVPVIIREFDDDIALQIGIIENLHREELNIIEEAHAYQRLIQEFSYSQEDLSRVIGKSRSHITNNLRILTLPDAVITMIIEQKISAGHARALVTMNNPESLANDIVKKQLSVRDIEKKARQLKQQQTPLKASNNKQQKPADIIALENELAQKIGSKATITTKGDTGSLTLHFQDLQQLDAIMQKLMV